VRDSRPATARQVTNIAAGVRVVMDPKRALTVSVYRNGRRIWSAVPRMWEPWRLAAADVDGDGRREIVVGLYKRTRFFPAPHNCLFVYEFTGKSVRPKWLGSRLSLPFIDFRFANLDRDRADELVALERRPDGRLRAVVYLWNGFGFDLDRVYGPWKSAAI